MSALRALCILLASLVLLACSSKSMSEQPLIRVKGSDTMVILLSALAEEYMKKEPKARISVTGGGTRSGVCALINETADLLAASRDLSSHELELSSKKGIQTDEQVIAVDGIAIIVNKENSVDALTLEDLKAIFTGKLSNWKELGGADQQMIVYSREASSGTFRYLQSEILADQDFSQRARFLPSNSSILASVTAESGAIGYVSLGHAGQDSEVKILKLKRNKKSSPVLADLSTVRSGEYPISRKLILYSAGNSLKKCRKFLDFCMGQEGQKIVERFGYARVSRSEKAELISRQ